jgi:hypothetical protein
LQIFAHKVGKNLQKELLPSLSRAFPFMASNAGS